MATSVFVVIGGPTMGTTAGQTVPLPEPTTEGELTLEEALRLRRSVRELGSSALPLADLGQLLWAAQGVTDRRGYRTAPSAGALYPLELYVVAGNVEGLRPGVYRYDAGQHVLRTTQSGDRRRQLRAAALDQEYIEGAAAVLVITAVYARTAARYGDRAARYVHMESGHAAQNVYLQAVARDLATVLVGAFQDGLVQEALGLPSDHEPLGLMPVSPGR